MPLPGNVRTVMLTATYLDAGGHPMTGKVTFSGKVRLRDADASVILVPVRESVTLDVDGSMQIELPVTDEPDLEPSDWFYTVREDLATAESVVWRRSFGLQLPTTLPAPPTTTDLAALATIDTTGGYGEVHGVDSVNGLTGAVTIPGAGPHTHAVGDVTTLATQLSGKADVGHTHEAGGSVAWGDVTGKPTEFTPTTHTHPTSQVTGLDAALAELDADKADLIHTHGIGAVTGLQTALDAKSDDGHGHVIADTTGLQTALDGKADDAELAAGLAGKADTGHTHTIANTTGLQTTLDGKADDVHAHVIGDTTGLQSALDSKAGAAATAAEFDAVDTALAGKANTGHGHAQADVTNLVTDLAAKADDVHGHTEADITGLVADLAAKAPLAAPILTGPVRVRMAAGLSFLVQNEDGTVTYFSVGDGAVNFNVPFGIYYFDLTGQRIYQGTTDPDPGAPNGSRWLSPSGLRIRSAGVWSPPIGAPSSVVLGADVTNATTTPVNIAGLSLTVPEAGTYKFLYEIWAESTVATATTDVQWSVLGPTVSSVRMNSRKLFLATGPGAVFATAFGTLMGTGTGVTANQPFKEVLEGVFIATAAGTVIPRVNPAAASATATVRALSTGTLTRLA